MKILFLGNSFTYCNDLPETVRRLAEGAGKTLSVRSITKGGASLREFLNPENQIGSELQLALKETWDYVVFQEQSFRPVGNPDAFLSAAEELSRLFPRCVKLFYQTWAYRDGSPKLQETNLTYCEMYEGLKRSYRDAATRCGGILVPVGDCFCRIWKQGSPVNLYRPDDFHPSMEGTYLAACSFVAEIFKMDPRDLVGVDGISSSSASLLRETAAKGKAHEAN